MSADRRQFLRVACRGAIAEVFVQGTSVGMHSVQDVSEGGLFLESPSPVLPLNTRVEVSIVDSRPEARCKAQVVQVVRPGSVRPSGYALKLDASSSDIVSAVVGRSAASPAPQSAPTRSASSSPAAARAPTNAPEPSPRVIIALNGAGLRRALCESLVAFRVPAVQASPDALESALHASLRVALIEMRSVEAGLERMQALRQVAPRARAFLLARKLPNAEARSQLQRASVDQLMLPPVEPFKILEVLFTKARGDLAQL